MIQENKDKLIKQFEDKIRAGYDEAVSFEDSLSEREIEICVCGFTAALNILETIEPFELLRNLEEYVRKVKTLKRSIEGQTKFFTIKEPATDRVKRAFTSLKEKTDKL